MVSLCILLVNITGNTQSLDLIFGFYASLCLKHFFFAFKKAPFLLNLWYINYLIDLEKLFSMIQFYLCHCFINTLKLLFAYLWLTIYFFNQLQSAYKYNTSTGIKTLQQYTRFLPPIFMLFLEYILFYRCYKHTIQCFYFCFRKSMVF